MLWIWTGNYAFENVLHYLDYCGVSVSDGFGKIFQDSRGNDRFFQQTDDDKWNLWILSDWVPRVKGGA